MKFSAQRESVLTPLQQVVGAVERLFSATY